MKPSSKAVIYLLVMISFSFFSCRKGGYMNDGVITGFDARACPCCGGLMINFKGETQPYRGEFYLIQNSPAEFGIDSNSVFPMYVKVDWTSEGCTVGALGNLIKITKYKKK